MNDEGYIKFSCAWNDNQISIPSRILDQLNFWREKLYKLSLIGMYDNGIGFGNISMRNPDGSFYISGSATGGRKNLLANDYALVQAWEFDQNLIHCVGKTKASSESMTHAAIYESDENTAAVIHIHNEAMWQHYLHILPTSSEEVAYGTPEMAKELTSMLSNAENRQKAIVVMGGHREGVISFGKNLDEAGNCLLDFYNQSLNNSDISIPESK